MFVLLKGYVNMPLNDLESTWRQVSSQFDDRRDWIEKLDAKLAAIEDARIDRVCEKNSHYLTCDHFVTVVWFKLFIL